MKPEVLKQFSLLAEFSEEERDALIEVLEKRILPNGKSIFREGAEAEGLVLLEKGSLKLKSRRTGGIVGVLEAQEHLGGGALFGLGQREVTALADGPSTVWTLSRSGLARLVEDSPRAAFRLAEAIASELVSLLKPSVDLLVEHTVERD